MAEKCRWTKAPGGSWTPDRLRDTMEIAKANGLEKHILMYSHMCEQSVS